MIKTLTFSSNLLSNSISVVIKRLSSTIYGLSSGHGKCGVAVIRISGPDTKTAITTIAQLEILPNPRYAYLKKFYHPTTSEMIDKGLLLWFPGPNSFTGEDSCEFQIHGGPAVIRSILDAISKIKNCRPAKAGEFTKRAFYNNKLDLTEVEGLADLIHSETEFQRKQALLQAQGALSSLYQNWRRILIKSIAHLEAYIDFSEDENIEDDVVQVLCANLAKLESDIRIHLNDGRRGERLRCGARAVILGAPNVGKSSFMNMICQNSISIVTNIEGTTRDIIESNYNIAGYPVIFADTAGLRKNTEDVVELEGISRARSYAKNADFIILIIDAVAFLKHDLGEIEKYKITYFRNLGLENSDIPNVPIITVLNKVDLLTPNQMSQLADCNAQLLSCKNSFGHTNVVNELTKILETICGNPTRENPLISQARHRFAIEESLQHLGEFNSSLKAAMAAKEADCDFAILAQRLRRAVRCLGQITGDVNSEEILDVIFKDFCIGK